MHRNRKFKWKGIRCFRLMYPRLFFGFQPKRGKGGGSGSGLRDGYGMDVYVDEASFCLGGGVASES